jgi:hypothetical protein
LNGIEPIIYIATLLISLTVVGKAGEMGYLNGAFQRAFAGVGTQVVSANFLLSYTNFETFLRACLNGSIGIHGYAFLLALGVLLIVWINNLIEYRQAII